MRFYLGTHRESWLWKEEFRGVPLFVPNQWLRLMKRLRPTAAPWALDSGGFTQLSKNKDGWPPGCEESYVADVRRYLAEMGNLEFAAQQDWMCEPWLLNGRTVREHQHNTVANYRRLVELAPDLPWIPVLQGWDLQDYHNCLRMFEDAGFDLRTMDRVGVGSVCRRQDTTQIHEIMDSLHGEGLRLHGFGVKSGGLLKYGSKLASADSLAWSFHARHARILLPGCVHGTKQKNCANCPIYARAWRVDLLLQVGRKEI